MKKHHGKYKQLRKEFVCSVSQNINADCCLLVKGDIVRENIKDGDVIFIEKSKELRDGLAYIDVDGIAELRRVYIGGGTATLQSLGDFTQIIKTELQNIHIIGYATYILKQL